MTTPARNAVGIMRDAYDMHDENKYHSGDAHRGCHMRGEEFRDHQIHAADKGEKSEPHGNQEKYDIVAGIDVEGMKKDVSVRFRGPDELRKIEVFSDSGCFLSVVRNSRQLYATNRRCERSVSSVELRRAR